MSKYNELVKKQNYATKRFLEYRDESNKIFEYFLKKFIEYFDCSADSIKIQPISGDNGNEHNLFSAVKFREGYWGLKIVFTVQEAGSFSSGMIYLIPIIFKKEKTNYFFMVKDTVEKFQYTEEELFSNKIFDIFDFIYKKLDGRLEFWIDTNFSGFEENRKMGFEIS